MKKKIVTVLLATVLTMAMVTGCGSKAASDTADTQADSVDSSLEQLQQQLDEQKPDHDDEDDRDELLQRQGCKEFLDGSAAPKGHADWLK